MAIPIITLTGSNGKTTTKELIAAVLAKKYSVISTSGNLNNHIGVPLTLLNIRPEHDFGVVEMGASHPTEIAELASIVQANFGYITNFGRAHLEGFGGVDGVVKAKAELYDYLKENKKLAFVNADDQKQMQLTSKMERYTFSRYDDKADFCIKLKDSLPFVSAELEAEEFTTELTGDYNFNNIAAACAIGHYFGVLKTDVIAAVCSYTPENARSQWIEKNDSLILLDAYNANPTSMFLAASNFSKNSIENNLPKIAVLGDMFELGKYAAHEHQHIVGKCQEFTFDKIYLIGENFYQTKISSDKIQKFESFEDFEKNFKAEKATYLIKGSRGMKMERVLDLL